MSTHIQSTNRWEGIGVVPRVKVRRAADITLPEEARVKLGVSGGDYLDVEVVENGVLLKPAAAAEIEATIAEGLEDVRAGRVYGPFENIEEMKAYFKQHPLDED